MGFWPWFTDQKAHKCNVLGYQFLHDKQYVKWNTLITYQKLINIDFSFFKKKNITHLVYVIQGYRLLMFKFAVPFTTLKKYKNEFKQLAHHLPDYNSAF